MTSREWWIALSVLCIFINLGLLGFGAALDSTEAQALAVLNIILLAFIFIPRKT